MAQLTQNPPGDVLGNILWCIEWIYQLRGRLGSGGGGGSSIILKTNSVNNTSQTILNLINGSNIAIVDNGGGEIEISAIGGSATLTENQVAYGSPTNTVTSSSNLIYQVSSGGVFRAFAGNAGIAILGSTNAAILGDYFNSGNGTKLKIDDNLSLVTVVGNKVLDVSPKLPNATFTGGGLNDMTNTTSAYTGIAASTIYTITLLSTTPGNLLLADEYSWDDGSGPITLQIPNGGGTQALSNGVIISWGFSSGHTIGDVWSFTYTVAYETMLTLDGQNHVYTTGDINGINNGLYDQVDDGNKLYNRVSSKSTNSWILSTSLESLTADRTRAEPDASGTYALVSNLGGTITTPAYGTTIDLSVVTMAAGEIRDIEFASGTGSSGVLFPTGTNAAIGAIIIVSDLLAIAITSNITADAGTGNTLNSTTVTQTKVMNVSGTCWTYKKITANAWKLQ